MIQDQPEAVGLAAAEVPALHGVLHEACDAVVVHLAAPRGVDATLGCDAVRSSRGVVEGETLDVVPELSKCGGAARAGQPGANDDDGELAPVQRAHEAIVQHATLPGLGWIPGRDTTVDSRTYSAQVRQRSHRTNPNCTASGMLMFPTITVSASRPPAATQTPLVRCPVTPRSLTAVQSPWARCVASTAIANR